MVSEGPSVNTGDLQWISGQDVIEMKMTRCSGYLDVRDVTPIVCVHVIGKCIPRLTR